MKYLLTAVLMTGLVSHAYAAPPQTSDTAQSQSAAVIAPCVAGASNKHDDSDASDTSDHRGGAVVPCAGAAGAEAAGNLVPVYVAASVVGTAVVAGALSGGGGNCRHRCDPAGQGGGTGGTTGTTGTTGGH